ncbi:MAG TPA: hypothetical protein VHL58_13170 [Thermoanaerobaculia bacterium]|nr:hypothetical protein [Thermoanaerobaculia bacterium]
MRVTLNLIRATAVVAAALTALSCNEANRGASPVELVATNHANILVLDFADSTCGSGGLGTITLRSIIKRTNPTDVRFLDVKLKSYRVTYQRTDGGKLIPQSFVRSISGIIGAGQTALLNDFLIFEPGAFSQAPFAALLPQNGGIDPETGKRTVTMEIIVDVFGETLAGDDVSARTRIPLTFCDGCGCVKASGA